MNKRETSNPPAPNKSIKLAIVPCTLRKANDFVQINHRHSMRTSRDGGKFAIAASAFGDIVGVAIVGNPLSATLMDGFTAEVLRVCVIPDAPRNCNSWCLPKDLGRNGRRQDNHLHIDGGNGSESARCRVDSGGDGEGTLRGHVGKEGSYQPNQSADPRKGKAPLGGDEQRGLGTYLEVAG